MKIGNVQLEMRAAQSLILPREPEPLEFIAAPVADLDEFYELCPYPKAPGMMTKDGWVSDYEEPGYKSLVRDHETLRFAYIVIKSLEPSRIEWDTVDPAEPKTWLNYEKDLRGTKENPRLTYMEFGRVMVLVQDVNCLNAGLLEVAKQDFFRKRERSPAKNTRPSDPDSSQCIQPAECSESSPPASKTIGKTVA